MGQKLNQIPGKPEVWKVGNKYYLVYIVPGTKGDPIYMAWEAPSLKDVQSWFGPDQEIVTDKVITPKQFKNLGALDFGSTDEIPPGADNPFSTWEDILNVESISQPWILDDDYLTLMAMALVEGRELTQAEIQTTEWWQTHNSAEREWMALFHGDPETAKQKLADNKAYVKSLLTQSGGGMDVDQSVIDFIATRWTMGAWSQTFMTNQVKAITDPFSGIKVAKGLKNVMKDADGGGVTKTNNEEQTVKDMLDQWLGPMFGAWTNKEIKNWAGKLRNDPNAIGDLTELLKKQRLAILPQYSDPNMTYAEIANTWKQWWIGQWGELPDEKSNLFVKVLQNNDIEESAKLLRGVGLQKGVKKVITDFSAQTLSQTGGAIRNPLLG